MTKPYRVSVVLWIYADSADEAKGIAHDLIETDLHGPNFTIESVTERREDDDE